MHGCVHVCVKEVHAYMCERFVCMCVYMCVKELRVGVEYNLGCYQALST